MTGVPHFDADGLLPAGDYELSLDELRASSLVLSPQDVSVRPNWDAAWRRRLVDNLAVLVGQLWNVGVTRIVINGSFVEDKDHPNDIDGYFECDFWRLARGALQRDLNMLDPHKIWAWDPASRRPYRGYTKAQLPMWHAYRVELYPHARGILSGLTDEFGNELEFPAAFRRSRRVGRVRGVVSIRGDR
jgi:hypothetical protein